MLIPIAEIFGPTIQGEGPHVGMKTLFVRVAGCDFKCDWCDSKFAWTVEGAQKYEAADLAAELVNKCQETHTSNVVLTGGNPCLYDFSEVLKVLHRWNITVDVETQGSIYPEWLYRVDLVVISPKAPSSKQRDVFEDVKKFLLDRFMMGSKQQVAIKIPVFDEVDFEFAKKYYDMVMYNRDSLNINVDLYLSVGNTDVHESGVIAPRVLADYENLIDMVNSSEMKRVFILPQVHTLVWGNKQGV